MAGTLPDNPLPPCPAEHRFACVRASRAFAVPPAALLARAEDVLSRMNAEAVTGAGPNHLRATFKVVVFRDDVDVVVAPHAGGAVLHVRSMSRDGFFDLFVNRLRVRRFFALLEAPQ